MTHLYKFFTCLDINKICLNNVTHMNCCNFPVFSARLPRKPDVVVIHDGVRPFVPEDILTTVVEAAKEYGVSLG